MARELKAKAISIGIFLAGTAAICAQTDTPLRIPLVGTPPYDYADEEGHVSGLVPALMRELGRRLNRPVQFVPSNARAAEQGVRLGRFDIHVMPRTEEWRGDFWYSPTVLFHYRYAILASNPEKISSLADLTGKKMAVPSHDAAEFLLGRYPGIEKIAVPDYETGLNLTADGHADFFLGNYDICSHLIHAGRAPSLRPVLDNMILTPACFTVSSSRPALIENVDRAVKEMSQDGTLDRLVATWLGKELEPPALPYWLGRNLRAIGFITGGVMTLLLFFIGLLQVLVNRRTKSLMAAQQSIRQSALQYQQIFNTANDAIFLLDLEGRVLECSERVLEIYGFHPEELKGQLFSRLSPDDRQEEARRNLDELRRQGSNIREIEHARKGGERVYVELSERIIQWQDHQQVIVSCVRDITDRKRAEEALRESQTRLVRAHRMEMAGLMAGQIAHDFNNLLSPMLGLPDLIKAELPETSPARQDMELIRSSAQRMAEVSQQLLTLGRRGQFNLKPLNLNKIIEDSIKGLDARRLQGIEVCLELHPGLPAVLGASTQLLRAVSNLIWNAAEAMGDAGRLTIRTEQVHHQEAPGRDGVAPASEYVRVTVQDTGVGIPETVLDRIFEPFYTTKRTTRQRGSGLGLSVVQSVVTDHGGFIEVHSAVGRGSKFCLYFPISSAVVEEEKEDAGPLLRGTERLLLVDDDELQISVFSRVLAGLGYQVASERSGEAAVERIKSEPFDLVLLDMVMDPGMDGVDTYQHMLQINPRQRALIISGYAETRRVTEIQSLGAGPVLRKPVSREALARAVRAELDK